MVGYPSLNIEHFPVEKIQSIGTPKSIEVSWDGQDVLALLQEILPGKKGYFEGITGGNLTLSLLPDAPFIPDPLVQADFLFEDFRQALEDFGRTGLFREIEVLGFQPGRRFKAPGVVFRNTSIYGKTETALLNLLEFSRLYGSVNRRQFENRRMVTLWEGPSRFWTACVPEGLRLKDFIPNLTGLQEGELDSRSIRHPMTGEVFSPLEEVSARTNSLCLSREHWELQPLPTLFFPFPHFNRQLKWIQTEAPKEGSSDRRPCSNCLSCAKFCPAALYPSLLYHYLEADQADEAEKLKIRACIGCGFCSVVCPSKIPLAAGIIDHLNKEDPINETT